MTITWTAAGFDKNTRVQFSLLQVGQFSILLTLDTAKATSLSTTFEVDSDIPSGQYWIACTPPGIYNPIYSTGPASSVSYGDTGFTITQPTCSAHTSCASNQYCASRRSSGTCVECSLCKQFRDAIDLACPAKCGSDDVPFGTSVPALPEIEVCGPVTLPTCGLPNNLVNNTDANIVFAPASASNNPRRMTSRLRTFLTALAPAVKSYFKG